MKTAKEKTLEMRISYMFGEIWDIANQFEEESENSKPKDHFRHIRKFYATELRKLALRLQKEVPEIHYEEIE